MNLTGRPSVSCVDHESLSAIVDYFWEGDAVILETDEEQLCFDVPVGRIRRRQLSIDVSFCHRDTTEWGGVVKSRIADFEFSGVFLELGVQGILRRVPEQGWPRAGRPRPHTYWPGMQWWDTPRWDVSRMVLANGVQREDLVRLHDLAAVYCHSMVTEPGRVARVMFISRAHELEIRQIAERLRATVS